MHASRFTMLIFLFSFMHQTTISEIQGMLSSRVPGSPSASQMRLIYRGRMVEPASTKIEQLGGWPCSAEAAHPEPCSRS